MAVRNSTASISTRTLRMRILDDVHRYGIDRNALQGTYVFCSIILAGHRLLSCSVIRPLD